MLYDYLCPSPIAPTNDAFSIMALSIFGDLLHTVWMQES